MSIVKAKPRSTSPPKMNSDSTDRNVAPAVMTRAAEGLVHAVVDDLLERISRRERRFSPHAIEDDDGVVAPSSR